MAKDNNIVTRRDYLDVFSYLFTIDSSKEAMSGFNSFWKKHIKGKTIPFGNLTILKIIINKYKEKHPIESLTKHYIKFESLYLRLKPETDKDIEIFLNLCDILISNIDSINIDEIDTFYNLFNNKNNLLKILNYITETSSLISEFSKLTNILKDLRELFIDENDFCQVTLFVFYQFTNPSNSINIFNKELNNKVIYEIIIKKLVTSDFGDKKDILEKLKSLRDKYKNIEKRNNTLSDNVTKYNELLKKLETYLEEEVTELKKQEQTDETNTVKSNFEKLIANYSNTNKKYHEKFNLILTVLYMNNYVSISGPKECGKNTIVNELKDIFNLNIKKLSHEDIYNYDLKNQDFITTDIYKILTEGGLLVVEIDDEFLVPDDISQLIYASQNLNNYINFNGTLVKINPNFKLCIINHDNKQFNEYASCNSIINVECNYDEKLEQELISESMMDFFKEYRKDLEKYNITLTTKDITKERTNAEMIDFFNEINRQIKQKANNKNGDNVNYYINLTQNYDPSNLLYSLFNEWQLNIDLPLFVEENQKTLIKRMR